MQVDLPDTGSQKETDFTLEEGVKERGRKMASL